MLPKRNLNLTSRLMRSNVAACDLPAEAERQAERGSRFDHRPNFTAIELRGFTLVELLVVIAIIGSLIAILLPAVQAAREAARMTHCKNNLRQIALAMLEHEAALQSFPTGGWSSSWIGDPNAGTGARQPGGWIYQALPYLDQQTTANIGLGAQGVELVTTLSQISQVVNPIFHCPSRRPAQAYPAIPQVSWNYRPLESAAKTDYAANGGSQVPGRSSSAPSRAHPFVTSDCQAKYPDCQWANKQRWMELYWNGIVGDHSGAQLRQVTDGASKTLLAGEKWLFQLYYDIVSIDAEADNSTNRMAADNPGDDGSMYTGLNYDTVRACSDVFLPKRDTEFDRKHGQQDKKGAHYQERFGSAHPSGFNLAKCDGSVDTWRFDVSPSVWSSLGSRDDRQL